MKIITAVLPLFLLASAVWAENGGVVSGGDYAENRKYRYSSEEDVMTGASAHQSLPEDKKYRSSAEGWREADYEERGLRNSFNGVLSMWGKLITNALPSDEPLPVKKKPAAPGEPIG